LEDLNVTVLVVSQTVLDYSWGLAKEAHIGCDWLNDYILLNSCTDFETEFYGPNVLALDLTIDVVWATATPTILSTVDNCVEAVA
jgi:hypothetical protein